MKKLFATIAALFLTAAATTANAQAIMNSGNFGDFRIGIQLGLNVPTFGETRYGSNIGWNFGATAVYDAESFIPNSYLRASVLYTRKGATAGLDELEKAYRFEEANYKLHYFEVPVRFGYAYELNDNICLFGETGPYFAMRIGNSQRNDKGGKWDGTTYDYSQSPMNGEMEDYYDDLRIFDVGWGLHGGVIFAKKYQVMAGYDWGLCEAVPDITGSNRNFSVNLTVYFD